ncbi:unnamed protein product, partial [Symbiodinium sp. CCMP2456]
MTQAQPRHSTTENLEDPAMVLLRGWSWSMMLMLVLHARQAMAAGEATKATAPVAAEPDVPLAVHWWNHVIGGPAAPAAPAAPVDPAEELAGQVEPAETAPVEAAEQGSVEPVEPVEPAAEQGPVEAAEQGPVEAAEPAPVKPVEPAPVEPGEPAASSGTSSEGQSAVDDAAEAAEVRRRGQEALRQMQHRTQRREHLAREEAARNREQAIQQEVDRRLSAAVQQQVAARESAAAREGTAMPFLMEVLQAVVGLVRRQEETQALLQRSLEAAEQQRREEARQRTRDAQNWAAAVNQITDLVRVQMTGAVSTATPGPAGQAPGTPGFPAPLTPGGRRAPAPKRTRCMRCEACLAGLPAGAKRLPCGQWTTPTLARDSQGRWMSVERSASPAPAGVKRSVEVEEEEGTVKKKKEKKKPRVEASEHQPIKVKDDHDDKSDR